MPGDTAEARIAGKLRQLQRLVDGAPKQPAGAEGDAPEAAQAQVYCIAGPSSIRECSLWCLTTTRPLFVRGKEDMIPELRRGTNTCTRLTVRCILQ